MMSLLGNSVSAEFFLMVFISILLILYFGYKEWPEFKKRMSGKAKAEIQTENEAKTVEGRLSRIEKQIKEFGEMLSRDYTRLNIIEKMSRANSKAISDSLEERRIIMEALLAVLVGVRGMGTEVTSGDAVLEIGRAIKEINAYLNRQAHVNQEVTHDSEAPKLNPNI